MLSLPTCNLKILGCPWLVLGSSQLVASTRFQPLSYLTFHSYWCTQGGKKAFFLHHAQIPPACKKSLGLQRYRSLTVMSGCCLLSSAWASCLLSKVACFCQMLRTLCSAAVRQQAVCLWVGILGLRLEAKQTHCTGAISSLVTACGRINTMFWPIQTV